MAIVSSAEQWGGDFSSPALQAGDIVVAAVGIRERSGQVDGIAGPSGWAQVGAWRTGFRYGPFASTGVLGVWWTRVESAGVLSASFPLTPRDRLWSVVVRGYTAVAATAVSRQNAQTFTYPGVDFGQTPFSGDLVYVGAAHPPDWNTAHEPGSAVLRQEESLQWSDGTYYQNTYFVIATDSFSSVSSIPRAASAARTSGGWTVTLAIADVAGPDAPTITSPVGASVDLAAGFDLEWVPSGVQTGYAVRAKKGAGAWAWWDGDGFDSASEAVVTSTQTSITVPAGELTNGGDTWTIEVATKGGASRPELGVYASRDWTGWGDPTAPTVTVTDVTAGVLDSFTPTISLSGSVASGASGPHYHMQILDSNDGVLIDTGVIAWDFYAVSVEQGAVLSRRNREDITVVGWTVQNGGQYSEPTEVPLHLDVVTPAAPSLTVDPTSHPVSGLPGTLVTVTPDAPITDGTVEVRRVHDGGSDLIWSGDIAVDGWDVADYLAPTAVAVHYEARVTTPDAIPLTSPWGQSANVTVTLGAMQWLVDVLHPEASVPVQYQEFNAAEHGSRSNAYQPLGSSEWLVHTGGRVDPTSSAKVATLDPDAAERAVALLTSGRPLMARMPPEREGGVHGTHAVDDVHFRVTGDVSVDRVVQSSVSWRHVSFSYVHVDPPEWPQQ